MPNTIAFKAKNSFHSSCSVAGYPRNPFNDVICNDTISASGVFTAKELCRLSRGKCIFFFHFPRAPAQSADMMSTCQQTNSWFRHFIAYSFKELAQNGRTHLSSASIMSGSSSMHGGSGSSVTVSGQGLNGVKLEGQYYCNSYTPPTAVDHGLLPPSYSKLFLRTTIYHKYLGKSK